MRLFYKEQWLRVLASAAEIEAFVHPRERLQTEDERIGRRPSTSPKSGLEITANIRYCTIEFVLANPSEWPIGRPYPLGRNRRRSLQPEQRRL